jgi:hypothetical protein
VIDLELIDWYSGLLFVSDWRAKAAISHSKRLKRETFQSKALMFFFQESITFIYND